MQYKTMMMIFVLMAGLPAGCKRPAEKFFELGKYFEDRRQYGQAAVEYQKALDEDPAWVEAQYRLGRAYRGANLLEQAEAALAQAIKLDPKHADARIDLAEIYYSQEKLDPALELAQKALELKPGSISGLMLIGGILLAQEKFSEAAAKFEQALNQDPKNREVHYALAFAYFFDPGRDRKLDGLRELRKAEELGYPVKNAAARFDRELQAKGSSLEELKKQLDAPQPAGETTQPEPQAPKPTPQPAATAPAR